MTVDLGDIAGLATAIGLVDADGALVGDWFSRPGDYLSSVLAEDHQRAALLDLVDELLGGPDGTADEAGRRWIPVVEVPDAGFWSDPWAPGGPTEADLLERVVGMATPRTGGVSARAQSAASVAIPAQPALVDVCVHRRGLDQAAAGDVAVLLLRLALPTGSPPAPGPATWAATAALAVPGLEAAMHGVPPGGGPLPAGVSVAPWAVADTGTAVRRPTRAIRTAEAVVVTFSVDFTGLAGTWLLLAVVHHGAGTPDLSGATLSAQVLGSPHCAARSIQVV